MLDSSQIQTAADMLYEHWQRGTTLDALPPDIRPTTRSEGYAIQARIEDRSAAPLFGWKIAATSSVGQTHIGVDGPLAGRILAERVVKPGATISLDANQMRVAEAEFAFRMGADLAPRPTSFAMPEVLEAVEALVLTIEVPDSRFQNFARAGAPQLIADNACAHMLLVGEPVEEDWRALDLAEWPVVGRIEGKGEWLGKGANVLGDPRQALTWLANELSRHGVTLKAGQLVTTGTCVVPMQLSSGDVAEADFGALGRLGARFT